jgi:hypothetical protein
METKMEYVFVPVAVFGLFAGVVAVAALAILPLYGLRNDRGVAWSLGVLTMFSNLVPVVLVLTDVGKLEGEDIGVFSFHVAGLIAGILLLAFQWRFISNR